MPFDLSLMDDGATYTEEEVKVLIIFAQNQILTPLNAGSY